MIPPEAIGTFMHGSHAHDHGHGPGHGHDQSHQHAPASFGRAFALGAGLNAAFVVLQVAYGLIAGSTALLADAAHNAGDVLGLLAAWGASRLALRPPTALRTYGWGRGTIMASLGNAVLLLLSSGAIALEAVQRLFDPHPVAGQAVAWVAAAGILVNGGTALLFLRGQSDLNVRGAFLHLAADAAVSAGVLLAGVGIMLTGWHWLDPAASLAIVAVIVAGTWGLLRKSADLAMDAVPPGIDRPGVEAALRALPGVAEVHDLHIWALSTTSTALTAHLVHDGPDGEGLVRQATALAQARGIGHATIQVETPALARACALRPDAIV